jgi:hypothetical protein
VVFVASESNVCRKNDVLPTQWALPQARKDLVCSLRCVRHRRGSHSSGATTDRLSSTTGGQLQAAAAATGGGGGVQEGATTGRLRCVCHRRGSHSSIHHSPHDGRLVLVILALLARQLPQPAAMGEYQR